MLSVSPVALLPSPLPPPCRVNGELVMRAYTPSSQDDLLGHFELVVKIYFANQHPRFPEGGEQLLPHSRACRGRQGRCSSRQPGIAPADSQSQPSC